MLAPSSCVLPFANVARLEHSLRYYENTAFAVGAVGVAEVAGVTVRVVGRIRPITND